MIKNILRKIAILLIPSYRKRMAFAKVQQEQRLKDKVRIRSDKELQEQGQGLSELRDVLNIINIPYFISGGTLLGTIREKDFIRWDWDVGLDFKLEDVYSKRNELLLRLKEKGFEILNKNFDKTNFKINALKYNVRYEMLGYIKVGDMRYRKSSHHPDSFVESSSFVELRGEKYTTFADPLKYLEWFYGDWTTPRQTAKISAYVTTSSRTSYFSNTVVKFMSIFK